MDNLPANAIDLGVAAVLLVSALLAFALGLLRGALMVAAWIAAAVATVVGFDPLKPLLRQHIALTILADAVTAGAIFVVTLLVVTAICHVLSRAVPRGGAFGALDRSLGLVFGFGLGVVLVCLAYLGFTWVVPEKDRPAWVSEARSLPYLAQGAEQLRLIFGRYVRRDADAESGAAGGAAPGPGQPAESSGSAEGSGYKDAERNELDRLIQGTQ